MADKTVVFDVIARGREQGLDKMHSKMKIIGAAAGLLAVKFGVDSVKAYTEAEASQQKLTFAYQKFPKIADVSRGALDDLNSSLALKTKFDDDATASGEAVLAQYGLTGAQLKTLVPLMQDFAAKTGQDLPTAAGVLGKALLGQGRGLKQIGVNFKDTGSQAGNFGEVVTSLRSKVGGFAEQEGKTAAGQAAILKNEFGEVQEAVGKVAVEFGQKLLPPLIKTAEFVKRNSDIIIPLVGTLGGLAAAVWTVNKATAAWAATQKAVNSLLLILPGRAATAAGAEAALAGTTGELAVAQGAAATTGEGMIATWGKAPLVFGAAALAVGGVELALNQLDKIAGKFEKGSFLADVFDLDVIRGKTPHKGHLDSNDKDKAAAGSARDLAAAQDQAAASALKQADASAKSAAATKALAEDHARAHITIDGVTTAITKEVTAAGLLKTAFEKLNGISLSVEETENSFLDTLANLKTAHDAGTKSIAQNSEKSRANRETIVSLIRAANDAAQATADQTTKTKGLTAGVKAGSVSLKNHEDAIRRAAKAAGLDRDEVDALIRKLGKVPKNISSTISVKDAAARKKAAELKRWIENLHPIIEVTAHTSVTSGHGKLAIRDAGGPVVKGTPYLIGLNKRPEIFLPGASGQVVPMPRSSSGAAYGGGGVTWTGDLVVQAGVIANPTELRRLLIGELERAFRDGETVAGGRKAMR